MLRAVTSLLKSGFCTGSLKLNNPNVLCKALYSANWQTDYKNPRIDFIRRNDTKLPGGDENRKSGWLELNDKVYPPLPPGEEPRPAFVCHELLNVKYPPKKMWVAACFVRGMTVDEALKQLKSAKRKGALIVIRAIEEAIEMAIRDHNVEFRSNLWVAESFCHPGMMIKGIRRRGKGFINKIHYRYTNYYIRLEEGQPPEDYYCRKAQWTAPHMYSEWMKHMRSRKVSNSL